ncbi:MAG: hypothetical protein KC419_15060 [Anaerolineales bacterium]|nr:hypothetical protein [Anaerolineales bacterium]MCA9929804.1 hypothetical protein [Anaerolineales bacterium]
MYSLPKIKIWEPLLILIGVGLGILWLINALNTGNALWFLPIQPIYEPSRIVIRNYGETVTIRRGEPGYAEISEALNETLSAFDNTALISIGLSEETMRRYNEEELVLEAYYADDVEFNTPVRMQGVRQLLFPVDATHAGNRYVFIGSNGQWRVGAMVVADDTPLRDVMRTLGYLQDQ